jgi:hypothetical protein
MVRTRAMDPEGKDPSTQGGWNIKQQQCGCPVSSDRSNVQGHGNSHQAKPAIVGVIPRRMNPKGRLHRLKEGRMHLPYEKKNDLRFQKT